MELEIALQVLVSERPPQEVASLTSVSKERITQAQALLTEEPCLAAFMVLSLAARFGAPDVHFDCKDRELRMSFTGGQVAESLWESDELQDLWWLLLAIPGTAQLSVVTSGKLHVMRWDGRKVLATSGPNPKGIHGGLELRSTLTDEASPILSAMADKKIIDNIREGLFERARVYPLPIYLNGVLWEWPLDIKLERVCSFTGYDLVPRTKGELGFAVAHPWAHGCRYWLMPNGDLLDMVSKGASETQSASGNICFIPALGSTLTVERSLNLLRKRGQPCIELSLVRSMWSKFSYLPGYEQYLLSPRTVVFGVNPKSRVQMRPLRARSLFMQTDRTLEANVVVPVRDGLALDAVFVTTTTGGLNAIAVCPSELATTRQGRRLADRDAAVAWAKSLVELSQAQQAPLNS